MPHPHLLLLFALPGLNLLSSPELGNGQQDTPPLPEVNAAVLAFVDKTMGQRVGSGECWDLAAEALNAAGARWDGRYDFGTVVDTSQGTVLPGDIVQFKDVRVRIEEADRIIVERMDHHTAIVHAVHAPGRYTLAHQNFGPAGRKVGLADLDATNVVNGTITIYRPQR